MAADGLLAAADTTDNPNTACLALLGHGNAYVDSDPITAYHSYRVDAVLLAVDQLCLIASGDPRVAVVAVVLGRSSSMPPPLDARSFMLS